MYHWCSRGRYGVSSGGGCREVGGEDKHIPISPGTDDVLVITSGREVGYGSTVIVMNGQ